MQFTPLKDFHDEDLRSSYLVGLSYTVRPEDARLAELVPKWINEGKVRLGSPDSPFDASRVSGSGKVE